MADVGCQACGCPAMRLIDTEQRVGHAAAAFSCPECLSLVILGDATAGFVEIAEETNRQMKAARDKRAAYLHN